MYYNIKNYVLQLQKKLQLYCNITKTFVAMTQNPIATFKNHLS
jgi:hypothetical protein